MESKLGRLEMVEEKKIETCLNPDFDHLPPEQIYKEYEMEVPEEVMEFCELIEKNGGKALLVGGCVRDMIISADNKTNKLVPQDIDIEVYGIYPKDLLGLVKDRFVPISKGDTVGNKFELITVKSKTSDFKFDISIPREDNKTGVGNKGFETTSHPEFSIEEGARRRDTTCNSMAYDPLIKVTYDPYHGREDIRKGLLRATDEEKFIEDPVRILRLMRFAARYGWEVAPETEKLCIWMMDKNEMQKRKEERAKKAVLSARFDIAYEILDKSAVELDDEVKERIYTEFAKMFKEGGKPSVGLEFARRVGVIDRYFPWLAELIVTDQEYKWHPEGTAWEHTLQVADAAVEIAKRKNLSKDETLELVVSALSHDLGKPTKTRREWREVDDSEDMEPNWLPGQLHETFTYINDLQNNWLKEDNDADNKKTIKKQVITSPGHDMEGGWIAEEFLDAFAPLATIKIQRDEKGDYVGLKETSFQKELGVKAKILTEKHMQLTEWYRMYQEEYRKNPEVAKRNAKKRLGRLARDLAEAGTSIYMLSWVTEADQRGRNPNKKEPLKREEVKNLAEWQDWLKTMMTEVKVTSKLPDKIVKGEKIGVVTGLPEGIELGVVTSWVFDDQLAGEFTDVADGLARASIYAEVVRNTMQEAKEANWKTKPIKGKKKFAKLEDEVASWLKEDGVREKVLANRPLSVIEKVVGENVQRVRELGQWPSEIKNEAITERIPKANGELAAGFDAGVACALRLIPEDKEKLAAELHANYSLEAVEQVRVEIKENDPDSPTTWWLAACSVCEEGNVDSEKFLEQIEDFKKLASDPAKRLAVAKAEYEKMTSSFELKDFDGVKGIPYGTKDGVMQGAYLAGHNVAVMWAEQYGVYFVGTCLPSLGIPRDFSWSKEVDEQGRPKSGPVHESKQFVKCANMEEVEKVLKIAMGRK